MSNLEYLEEFFRKHNLSGKITVDYLTPEKKDDEMTDITFENGDVININDIIFDIDCEISSDMFSLWMKSRKESLMTLREWISKDSHYIPQIIDTSSIEAYHKEMESIIGNVKEGISKVFELQGTDEDGEDEDE